MVTVLEREPAAIPENELSAINKIETGLENSPNNAITRPPTLTTPDGQVFEVPATLFAFIKQLVYYLSHNRAVTIAPVNLELTTQEAADLLNISRPYLVKLLEQENIPYRKVGAHRRIRFSDLMEYKRRRDTEVLRGLDNLLAEAEELGIYD